MISGIYAIINIYNDKVYVGSAVNYKLRWNSHRYYLNKNVHVNKHLQFAWNKYGKDAFEFIVLEHCEKDKLILKEQSWIDWLKPEYNKRQIAESNLGIKHTKETLNKMSVIKVGKKHSEETKKKMSLIAMGHKRNLGKKRIPFSEEHIRKLSMSNKKLNKWPCKDGWKCKCKDCSKKRNELAMQHYYKRIARKNKIVVNSDLIPIDYDPWKLES